jgi:hypothetical protein
MAFSHKYNTDNVIIRAAIIGLVNELNNKINYENVWGDDQRQAVKVPFFYAMSGDERFLQDYFSNWSDCAPDFIEGNTDPIPRGTVFLTGVSILGSNLTSRYVRGFHNKEIDGELKRYNSYINSIPLQLNFSAEILADTSIDSFKIVQSAISTLYRTLVFNVTYEGLRIPTQAGFPEAYAIDKQFEFTYGNEDRIKVTFDVEVQTYLPLFDQTMFAGNVIEQFDLGIETNGEEVRTTVSSEDIPTPSKEETNYTHPPVDGTYNGENKPDSNVNFDPNKDTTSQFGENKWE